MDSRWTSSLRVACLAIAALATLFVASGAGADAPTLTVAAAQYAINAHSENWSCDGQSEIPAGANCKSDHPPASYTFTHHGHVVEDPNADKFVWLMDGGARDNGFAPNQVGDDILTFESPNAQATGKVYRKNSVEDTRSELGSHWEPFSAFWQSSEAFSGANESAFYWFVNVTDSGDLSMVTDNRLLVGESNNGTSSYTWRDIYQLERPTGKESGAMLLLTRDDFIPHRTAPTRWIGVVGFTRDTPSAAEVRETTPVYIDVDDEVVGFQFADDGWCEYPLGHTFDSYDATQTCSLTGNTSSTLPGPLYELGFGKTNLALAEINDKVVVLRDTRVSQTNSCAASDSTCQEAHAPCPPGQDLGLYDARREETEWDNSRYFAIRELALSTWNESSTGATFVGGWKQIATSSSVDEMFDVTPTDTGVTFGQYDVDLKQFSNGGIYMYMGIKHSLCQPTSASAYEAWDRFPKTTSGSSFAWFRLTAN